ncbi:MAG: hypothetical protein IJ423_02345 [Clostridia bacterium]|nr:hypothetical protein [Clostridia bacterium]
MTVNVTGAKLSKSEIDAYVKRATDTNPGKKLTAIDINVDGEYVDLKYTFEPIPFNRIRRVTGYLVGTLDRWNDAKKSEEADRVKHNVCC